MLPVNESSNTREVARIFAFQGRSPRLTLGHDALSGNFSINSSRFTIGRAPRNDLCIAHPGIGDEHAVIHFDGRAFSVEDRGCDHGVCLDGRRLAPGGSAELHRHFHDLRLGPISALFGVTLDDLHRRSNPEELDQALHILMRKRHLTPEQWGRGEDAAARRGVTTAEALVALPSNVTPSRWLWALCEARRELEFGSFLRRRWGVLLKLARLSSAVFAGGLAGLGAPWIW